ncbi:MAG: CPBP family intramembrane metalloprotease [Clostridia bacterium]|nr:CPBP family intramembrane metalloprotease [Clostridia bacterium]MBQ8793071.1 CPBP family intramembrane metalloprotease [Clostridia bacterium]
MTETKSISKKINRTSAITYFIIVALFVTIKMLSHYGVLSFLGEVGGTILSVFIQVGLLFLLSVGIMCFSTKQKPLEIFRFYGFKKISWKGVLISFVMGVVVYILTVYVATFFNIILQMLGYQSAGSTPMESYPIWLLFLNLFLSAVLPAFCEETAHRGMVLNGTGATKKRSIAIILTSILFGLLHCNIEQFFYATLIGFFLGYICSVMENIYPAVIIHFTNNAISIFMGYSNFHNLGANVLFTYVDTFIQNNTILGILFLIAMLVFLGLFLKFLMDKLFKHTILKQLHGLNDKVLKTMERDDYFQDLTTIVKTGEVYRPTQLQDFARFKNLFYTYGKEFGFTSQLKAVVGEEQPVKRDWVATAFYVASIVILSAVTIMSFIWGII